MRRLIFPLVCVLVISAGLLPGATGAVAAATPASAGTVDANVNAVSCSAPDACTAVGDYVNSSDDFVPLAMRWNGKAWVRQSAPAGGTVATFLFAVSCPSAAYCLAVGQNETSGALPSPTPFAEQWNGTRWSILPRLPGASTGFLYGVSCPSASSCEVVGDKGSALLAARWNGKSWAMQAVSLPTKGATEGDFSAVSCSSATHCAAVGTDGTTDSAHPVVAAWNGKSWTTATAALPNGAANPPEVVLSAVSCGSASSCTALGSSTTAGNATYYSASGSGTRWKNAPVVAPKGATGPALNGISCVAGTAAWCMAVGLYTANGKTLALAERWNGWAWSLTAPANSTLSATGLLAVSCRATTACQAVGEDGVGLGLTFAEGWNGKSWAIEPTPQPPASTNSHGTFRAWSGRPWSGRPRWGPAVSN
jgi:hypothetical protein